VESATIAVAHPVPVQKTKTLKKKEIYPPLDKMDQKLETNPTPSTTSTDDNERNQKDEQWTLCCSKSSKNFVLFMTQTAVLLSVLFFSIAMLATVENGVNRDLYVSLLSSVVGIYLPAPQIHDVKP
jgi:hypothetical protein